MAHRLPYALGDEIPEPREEHEVERPARGVLHQPPEVVAGDARARVVVEVLLHHPPAVVLAPSAQLVELLRLPVVALDAAVERGAPCLGTFISHDKGIPLRGG